MRSWFTRATWMPAILSLVFFGCLFIFMLIYSYINLDIITSIVLTPFILYALFAFYIWIREEVDKLNKK